jgi:hypothetical protein
MKPETERRLKAVFADRQKQKQSAAAQADQSAAQLAQNLADFNDKKQTIIRPAFEEIVNSFKNSGEPIRIEEQGESNNPRGGASFPSIALDLSVEHRLDSKIEFRLIFDKHRRSVELYTSTRTLGGPGGSVSLDTVTTDWIQDTFAKYFEGRLLHL